MKTVTLYPVDQKQIENEIDLELSEEPYNPDVEDWLKSNDEILKAHGVKSFIIPRKKRKKVADQPSLQAKGRKKTLPNKAPIPLFFNFRAKGF